MKTFICILSVIMVLGFGVVLALADSGVDKTLTKQIADVLKECQTIKPGMTRAEFSKVLTTEGGFSTARHRTYVYRGCPYIKDDVDFTLSDAKQGPLDERPTDIINKISKPYLEWSISD
ncbi:MAG: hypothetical protein ACLPYZ_16075 [Limisphaerales bacterium]